MYLANCIKDEGAQALGEAIKHNTALQQLSLKGTFKIGFVIDCYNLLNFNVQFFTCSGNDIGAEGAKALAESLKFNKVLIHLNLDSMSLIV